MSNIYSLALFRHDASGYESPRAGTSQGIFFDNFMPSVVRCFRVVYRDWELRIHHDARAMGLSCWPLLERLSRCGLLKLVFMGEAKTLCGSMLWRLRPLWEADADPGRIVVSRDVDSLPMHRDRKMVERAFSFPSVNAHAILDSESHSGPLMGGMVAFRDFGVGQAALELATDIDFNRHGSDQEWLNRHVWPVVRPRAFIHQRRRDVQYPDAYRTESVIPQETVLDQVVRHIGAGYDREKADKAVRNHHPDPLLDMLECMEWPKREHSPKDTGLPHEPWYTREAIHALERFLEPGMKVLEYGGGASSIWYANKGCQVWTIEHDPVWKEMIRHRGLSSVRILDKSMDLEPPYDLIAIDGVDRAKCFKEAMELVRPGGAILLDNSDTGPEKHIEAPDSWIKSVYLNSLWATTIWRRPE